MHGSTEHAYLEWLVVLLHLGSSLLASREKHGGILNRCKEYVLIVAARHLIVHEHLSRVRCSPNFDKSRTTSCHTDINTSPADYSATQIRPFQSPSARCRLPPFVKKSHLPTQIQHRPSAIASMTANESDCLSLPPGAKDSATVTFSIDSARSDTFTLFPCLPLEIRRMIWSHALPGKKSLNGGEGVIGKTLFRISLKETRPLFTLGGLLFVGRYERK